MTTDRPRQNQYGPPENNVINYILWIMVAAVTITIIVIYGPTVFSDLSTVLKNFILTFT